MIGRLVDGGWFLGRYWIQGDYGATVSEYPVFWFDDALSALEFLGARDAGGRPAAGKGKPKS